MNFDAVLGGDNDPRWKRGGREGLAEPNASEASKQARIAQERFDTLTSEQFVWCLFYERFEVLLSLPIYDWSQSIATVR